MTTFDLRTLNNTCTYTYIVYEFISFILIYKYLSNFLSLSHNSFYTLDVVLLFPFLSHDDYLFFCCICFWQVSREEERLL